MKTAMTEHIEWLEENQLYFGIPIEVIDNAKDSLEKEKEQIIDARNDGIVSNTKGYCISNEEYYNQTYKQDKECQHNVSRVEGNKQECLKCGKIIL